ncbi:MAG: hypothetical protein ACREP9_04710, partial [Candidatus Dormibacteraceae bacterium]
MKTHGATIWRFGAGLAALAMTTGAIICTPITASASAHGCVDNAVRPSSCIDIDGGGTYVNSVVGSVYLDGGSSVFGRFHIYGGGLEFKTNDAHYY